MSFPWQAPPLCTAPATPFTPRGTWLGHIPQEGGYELLAGSDVEAGDKKEEEKQSWVSLFWAACKYVWPHDPWLQVRGLWWALALHGHSGAKPWLIPRNIWAGDDVRWPAPCPSLAHVLA